MFRKTNLKRTKQPEQQKKFAFGKPLSIRQKFKSKKQSGAPKDELTISSKIVSGNRRSISLITVAMGIVSIALFAVSLWNSVQTYENNVLGLAAINNFTTSYLQNRVSVMSIATHTTQTNYADVTALLEDETTYNSTMSQVNVNIQNIRDNMKSPDEMKLYKQLQTVFASYIDVTVSQNKLAMSQDLDGINNSRKSTQAVFQKMDNMCQKIMDGHMQLAKQRLIFTIILFIISAAAVVASVLVGILLSNRMSRKLAALINGPIEKMTGAADRIAAGDLDWKLENDSEDFVEIRKLSHSFGRVRKTLARMQQDVGQLISASEQGDFSITVDVSNHSGVYKDIVVGMTDIFYMVNHSMTTVTETLGALAKGENVEVDTEVPGLYGQMASSMEQIRAILYSLHQDVMQLAHAGADGNLAARGDTARYSGIYAEIIQGINLAFENIQKPMDDVVERLTVMKDGRDDLELSNPYKGYPAKMIDSILVLYQELSLMLAESRRIAASCAQGDLTVRGDFSGLSGGHAEIVRGFDETLDSIIMPLNEAHAVLSALQRNDCTVKMEGQYKGAMAELAEQVNAVHAQYKRLEAVFTHLSEGDTHDLEEFRHIGRLCDQDQLTPSVTLALQSVEDLITQAKELAGAAKEGNLSVRADENAFVGGYRDVIAGMNETMHAFAKPIEAIIGTLEYLSKGDLTVSVEGSYQGVYEQMKVAINHTIDSFNELLGQMQVAASEVNAGSNQMSEASQALSQSAAEQAGSIEEVTSNLSKISLQTRNNADKTKQASQVSGQAKVYAEEGNVRMQDLMDAIHQIGSSAKNISKIIKTIDDIAFQTNVLALNAAVEAARAGQYGKGFAVVAEEVRNLANRSAAAVHDTTDMIETSLSKIKSGTDLADKTSEQFTSIAAETAKAAELLNVVAKEAEEQAAALADVDRSVSQISSSVQNNSATAEETAASSEELSGQAQLMLECVDHFHLRQVSVKA